MLRDVRTFWTLGPRNVARVMAYRFALWAGIHPVLRIAATAPEGPFFASPVRRTSVEGLAGDNWRSEGSWFSVHDFPLSGPPDWHANPFRPNVLAEAELSWNRIPDFSPDLGDIKTVWEASRFGWALTMAQRAALGEATELDRLNAWLVDWALANPPYRGVNWKCGQEASIRVIHLAASALILGQENDPLPGLRAMIATHLARIAPTISYAIGQANNHGTSEAAALFIGGSWLGTTDGGKYATIGRRWLEERAQSLIAPDGTFSQYSVVYHRMVLDTYALVETWRSRLQLPRFSTTLTTRLASATRWLQAVLDPLTGDAPNLGANDGARLIPLSDTPFRDFRPSLQLAAEIFCNARAIAAEGPWDQPLIWLGRRSSSITLPAPASATLDEGGFHLMRQGRAFALLRYPRFRFRPSQADALHLDLWVSGQNLLRDAGTYSYASAEGAWFASTAAHNTVEFDGRDQMPRLGRFLYGAWLTAENVIPVACKDGTVTAAAGYRDSWGARHDRAIVLSDSELICTDRLSGSARSAVLRWRLAPGNWRLTREGVTNGAVKLRLFGPKAMTLRLVQSQESRHYLEKTPLLVLEAKVYLPSEIVTKIEF
jgi:Heparinase II/III-like protein